MKKVIYPGTFDPPTFGHLDIAQRAASIFDSVVIAVGTNVVKKPSIFTVEERVALLKTITKKIPNIEVVSFSGLLVDFASSMKTHTVIRAIRTIMDFEYETMQAQMNKTLGNLETIYFVVGEKYRQVSSTLVREIARGGKRLTAFVPPEIEETVYQRLFSK